MRKVSLTMKVTVDGYVPGPDGDVDWLFRFAPPLIQPKKSPG
jgi:hypothetical protein